jgi:virginiamycin B lyase
VTGEGYVWVTRTADDQVIRIDPESARWTGELIDVGDSPFGIAVGEGSVWVANQKDGTITRVDP